MNEFSIDTFDNLKLSMAAADIDNPKAVVQIVHGLKEHKRRYYDFAQYLNNHGYAVYMSDNRGHGYSVNDEYPLSYMADIHMLVNDQFEITKYIKSKYNPFVYNVNVIGTKNIVEKVLESNAKLIYISSVHAIPEKPNYDIITEITNFNPDNVHGLYAKTKVEAAK